MMRGSGQLSPHPRLNVFQKYPTIVELDIAHSHDKDRFNVYMNRKPTPATKEKIFNLMEKGHKVSQILTMLTLDLEEELGDEEMKLRRFDNSVRPNRQYIQEGGRTKRHPRSSPVLQSSSRSAG